MALFRLEHTTLGKSTHALGTAAAHGRYITRDKACVHMIGINFSTEPHAARRQIEEHENSLTRKNARIADKILLSLPIEMNEEQQHKAVRHFLWHITGYGKARALACFHANTENNPHTHIFFVDKDENGKTVFGTSKKGSTIRLRELWEKCCNEKLAEFGIDSRIDRRSRMDRALVGQPQQVRKSYRKTPKATKTLQQRIEEIPPEVQTEQVSTPARKTPVEEIIRLTGGTDITSTVHKLQVLQDELNRLVETRQKSADLHAQKETNHAHLTRNGTRKREIQEQLDVALKSYKKARGELQKHKGIISNTLSFIGIKSKARKAAEAAYKGAEQQVERFAILADRLNQEHEQLQSADNEHHAQLQEAAKQLERWGSLPEIDKCETLLRDTISHHARSLQAEHVREALSNKEITQQEHDLALKAITLHSPRRDIDISH